MLHLFFDCKFATACWQKVGLHFKMRDVESALKWLLDDIIKESSKIVEKIVALLYDIWFPRNKVWEGKQINPLATLEINTKQVVE